MKHIMKSKHNKKFIIRIALIFLIGLLPSILGYFLIINPKRTSLKIIQDQIKNENKRLNCTLAVADEVRQNQFKQEWQQLQEQISKFVINLGQTNNLSLQISRIANKTGLYMFASQTKNERFFNEIPNCEIIGESYIDISFRGSFPQFATFLNALERYKPVIYVDKFVVSQTDKGITCNKVEMTLSMLVREGTENISKDITRESTSSGPEQDVDDKVVLSAVSPSSKEKVAIK